MDRDLENQTEQYLKAYFTGLLSNKAMLRVMSNGYLHHIANLLSLKVQDLSLNNIQDTRIHDIVASFDFGGKFTQMAFLLQFGYEPDSWTFSYGDSLIFELLSNNNEQFKVRTIYNDKPLDLDKDNSKDGVMPFQKWLDTIISHMYFGTLNELQGSPWAERPESHLIRDTTGYETDLQWFTKQKKYENRWLKKKYNDQSTLSLVTFDQSDK